MRNKPTLANRLRGLRKEANLSVAELARIAGVNRTLIWRIERGGQGARWATIVKIADALGVSTEVFRGE